MGNYNSCKRLRCTPIIKNILPAKVILPDGEIRQLRNPVKAAEVMLESPNCFLVNISCLDIGKRMSPLSADEDLEFGNVYIMFPMNRKKSLVTADDMAVVTTATKAAARRILRFGGVAKGGGSKEIEFKLKLDDMEGFRRLSGRVSRKPSLPTILEELPDHFVSIEVWNIVYSSRGKYLYLIYTLVSQVKIRTTKKLYFEFRKLGVFMMMSWILNFLFVDATCSGSQEDSDKGISEGVTTVTCDIFIF